MDDSPLRVPDALPAILAEAARLGFAMSCDNRTGALLSTLAASKPGGRLLELGTGTGAGTAWLLDGMSADASLVTVEMDPRVQEVARRSLGADDRVEFVTADADMWLSTYEGPPFDLAFVDCLPGKFHAMDTVVGMLRPGGFYLGDDLLSVPAWPADHQALVDRFLADLPGVAGLRAITLAWASGLVIGVRA